MRSQLISFNFAHSHYFLHAIIISKIENAEILHAKFCYLNKMYSTGVIENSLKTLFATVQK